jgi:Fic family protein
MSGSSYKQLKVIYRQSGNDARTRHESERFARTNSPSSLHWNYRVHGQPVFVNLVRELSEVLETIWRKELDIQRQWALLPGAAKNHYLHSLLISEIRSTNEIEGIFSTRQEVREAIQAAEHPGLSNGTLRPYQEMAKTYLLLFGELDDARVHFPSTLSELRELYDQLLGREIAEKDRLDGEFFRAGPVSITDGIKVIHRGAEGEESINAGIQTMLQSQQESAHHLVNALVGHFILEHVHPFYDGNGRFGRFLLSLRLTELLSAPTAISLSSAVLQQKNGYYKAFKLAEEKLNSGELTFFVMDLAKILVDAMEELLDSLVEKNSQLSIMREQVATLISEDPSVDDALDEKESDILFLLGQVHLFGPRSGMTMDELCQVMGRTRRSLRSVTVRLRERGMIRELKKSPLVFALTDEAIELVGIAD